MAFDLEDVVFVDRQDADYILSMLPPVTRAVRAILMERPDSRARGSG